MSSRTTIELGPFELAERIGQGGMGAVYRGRHRSTGVDVAVKVIRPDGPVEELREQFRAEVQAHARLVHPHVVYLFDYGELSGEAACSGKLEGGSHFVAMEYAGRGTLRGETIDDWPTLREALVQILDALAYAHARDVVHRDLKPENLLVFDDDGDYRIKLADFGLAHAFDLARNRETERLESVAGTPHYMAPEQAHGDWRKYGPWTDLYALGCITWGLVSGRPPFEGATAATLLLKHIEEDRPPLNPRFPIPDELQQWVHRAMAIATERRFQCAADALEALPVDSGFDTRSGLSPAGDIESMETAVATAPDARGETELETTRPLDELAPTLQDPSVSRTSAEDRSLEETAVLDEVSTEETVPEGRSSDSDVDRLEGPGHQFAVPPDWRMRDADELPLPLVGTGLGLFELRDVPFVDRDVERDELWERLRRVDRTGTPRLVGLLGASGAGKSRLAEWFVTRARELGAARVFRAVHTAEGQGRAEGLTGMIRRAFHAWKVDRRQLYRYLVDELPRLTGDDGSHESDARALTELVFPTNDDPSEKLFYRFSSPEQKYAVLTRLFRRFCRDRPVVVVVDDIQWNRDALQLVDFLLDETFQRTSILVVATLRSDVLVEQPTLAGRVEELLDRDRAHRIALQALGTDHHRQLVDRMLPLRDTLADTVVERTEGNPLFAVQLLGHWVQRDCLEAGDEGFELTADAVIDVPDDVHDLWMQRLDRVTEDVTAVSTSSAWRAIERAAILGREVTEREWASATDLDNPLGLYRLRERLVERGLAQRTEEGFAFTHGLLVDSIKRRTRQRGTRKIHHLACAEMLEDVYPDETESTARRRADHLIEAGRLEAALAPLFEVQDRLLKRGDVRARHRTLERREQLIDELQLSDDAPKRIENGIILARCELQLGADPEKILERLETLTAHIDDPESILKVRATGLAARCYRRLNRGEQARFHYESALAVLEQLRHPQLEANYLLEYSWVEYERQNFDRVDELLDRMVPVVEAGEEPYWEAAHRAYSLLVSIRRQQTRHPEQQLQRLLEDCRTKGFRAIEIACLNELGEVSRFAGDPAAARRWYGRYKELASELHRPRSVALSLLNLAQTELMARNFDAVDGLLEEYRDEIRRHSISKYDRLFGAICLTRSAGVGNWSDFDRLLKDWDETRHSGTPLVRDYPALFELAGDFAQRAGQTERADRIRRLADRLRAMLERQDGDEST